MGYDCFLVGFDFVVFAPYCLVGEESQLLFYIKTVISHCKRTGIFKLRQAKGAAGS